MRSYIPNVIIIVLLIFFLYFLYFVVSFFKIYSCFTWWFFDLGRSFHIFHWMDLRCDPLPFRDPVGHGEANKKILQQVCETKTPMNRVVRLGALFSVTYNNLCHYMQIFYSYLSQINRNSVQTIRVGRILHIRRWLNHFKTFVFLLIVLYSSLVWEFRPGADTPAATCWLFDS